MKPSYVIGLIGTGIHASLTPSMRMQEGEALGFRYPHRPIEATVPGFGVAVLSDVLIAVERMRFNGLNITRSCKRVVVPLLHDLFG